MRTIKFPNELLSASNDARYRYFSNYIAAHPKLDETHHTLFRLLDHRRDPATIIVDGLTGVGKSTLRRIIVKQIMDRFIADATSDRSIIPVVSISAVTPGKPDFDWEDFYARALLSMNEPLVDHKIDLRMPDKRLKDYVGYDKYQRMKSSALRRAFESALVHRDPKALLIDEAQAIGKISSGRKLLTQLEILKDITESTRKTLVLFGTHDLKHFMNLNGQTARRSIYIHFERYRADIPADITKFQAMLESFRRHIPIADVVDFVNEWEYFYAGSCGCGGTLSVWLLAAVDLALQEGSTVLSLNHLKRTALSPAQVRTIQMEALENEGYPVEKPEVETKLYSYESLRGLLRLPSEKHAETVVQHEQTHSESQQPVKKQPKKGNKRPGLRNPTRDPVGMKQTEVA